MTRLDARCCISTWMLSTRLWKWLGIRSTAASRWSSAWAIVRWCLRPAMRRGNTASTRPWQVPGLKSYARTEFSFRSTCATIARCRIAFSRKCSAGLPTASNRYRSTNAIWTFPERCCSGAVPVPLGRGYVNRWPCATTSPVPSASRRTSWSPKWHPPMPSPTVC